VNDPLAPMRIVITDPRRPDPALKMTERELEEYRRTRDEKLVRCKPGASPTWFHVQRLDPERCARLGSITVPLLRWTNAFGAACHHVEREGDAAMAPEGTEWVDLGDGERTTEAAWMKRVAKKHSLYAVYEVGQVALQFAALPEEEYGPFEFLPG
jgi:hypothetical protein